jgi:predicted  nucleic acid-binding Zn-ribbon protein
MNVHELELERTALASNVAHLTQALDHLETARKTYRADWSALNSALRATRQAIEEEERLLENVRDQLAGWAKYRESRT